MDFKINIMETKENKKLPSIIITGASGFIGRNLLEAIRDNYKIYAIARRSRNEAGIPFHKNILWMQCDIGNSLAVEEVKNKILDEGGVDYCLHLAAYYDFRYGDNPEYHRTNVVGTDNILKMARSLELKRFIFVSSLAACNFPEENSAVNEKTPPDANFAYAKSKKLGEEMVKEYSERFPCLIVRLAAVYSDWCEYPPLYKFLSTWLAGNWDSRFLAGRGESAVTYIHINDLCKLFKTILSKTNELPQFDTYNASPDDSTSHRELFRISTNYFFGNFIKPFYIPKIFTYPGLIVKNLLNKILQPGNIPFETFWMIKYIDLKLDANSLYTRKALVWEPVARYNIQRRLLFLIEKMKSHPDEWKLRNEAALKRVINRPNLIIYENMIEEKENILSQVSEYILSPENKIAYSGYNTMKRDDFEYYLSNLYEFLLAVVRSGDRSLIIKYIGEIALKRFEKGFKPDEICNLFTTCDDIILTVLISKKQLQNLRQAINDYVTLSIQITKDEIEDLYDSIEQK